MARLGHIGSSFDCILHALIRVRGVDGEKQGCPGARIELGDYQIDNLKLTTLVWWSGMHGGRKKSCGTSVGARLFGSGKIGRNLRVAKKMLG
jgi:hypothetical protein